MNLRGGVQIDLTVDSAEIRAAVAELLRRSLSLRPAFEEIGASLETSTQQRFQDEEDPEGNPWAELSDPYAMSFYGKDKDGNKQQRGREHILRRSALLFNSLAYMATSMEVAVGPSGEKDYAAIHQFGGTSGMRPGPAAIPARPYLGLSQEDEREIGLILADHLSTGIDGFG